VSEEDREAVRRVQAGETEAFEVLVEKYRRKTFRLAFSVLRDQEEALDVAQEAFVKAFRSLPKFKGDSAFYTWLFRITMNLALDRRRQRITRTRSMGGEDVAPEEWERTAVAGDPSPDEEAVGAERRSRIARALESLPEHHRSIIILSDIEGLSYREIAEVLAIPMGTVMSRLHNARKRLREALGPAFLAGLLACLFLAAAGSALAQGPPPPPPMPGGPPYQGPAPPPPPAMPSGQRVCVYALVMLASNEGGRSPAGPLTPTPSLRPPTATPPGGRPSEDWAESSLGTGCGREVRLQPWVPRLREIFGYAVFEPISAFETTMPIGVRQRFALPGGRELSIQPLGVRPPIVRMAIQIWRGPIAEIATVMDVPARRPALIGGPPHGPGVLIIAIRSRPDP
jgi:RNA polymerase sigma-70 factor (ECF subfamily)